jgi:DHA2 family multidrug resistance protein
MLIRELKVKNPIVDLRVFLNRNFLIGCMLITIFSVAMYGGITGVPLFLQTLMGYTSYLAGNATAPRGIAAALAMPLIGYLLSRIDGRWIAAFGLLTFGIGTFQLGNINLAVSMNSITWPCAMQGIGMSCIFVSLMTLGMGTLPNEKMANASGLFNLVRNLGGSVGIALVNTFVSRGLQSHYSRFIPHVTVYDPIYQQGSQLLQHSLTPLTGAPQAGLQAQGLIQGILLQQASLMAYIDIFRWTAFVLIIIVPCAFLLKRVVAREGSAIH